MTLIPGPPASLPPFLHSAHQGRASQSLGDRWHQPAPSRNHQQKHISDVHPEDTCHGGSCRHLTPLLPLLQLEFFSPSQLETPIRVCVSLCRSRPAWRGGGQRAAGLVRAARGTGPKLCKERTQLSQGTGRSAGEGYLFPETYSWMHFLRDPLLQETLRSLRGTCWVAATSPSQGTSTARRGAVQPSAAGQGQQRGRERRKYENSGSRYLSGSRPEPQRKGRCFYRRDACVRPVHSSLSLTLRLNYTLFRTPLVG